MPRDRKTYLLIEQDGQRLLVKSLKGHEGAKVIHNRVPEPKNEHCQLCPKGTWVEDKQAKERGEIRKLIREGRLGEALDRLGKSNA